MILALNAGSSSIRFATFEANGRLRPLFRGKVDRIGGSDAALTFSEPGTPGQKTVGLQTAEKGAAAFLLEWLEVRTLLATATAVGHRVVHGLSHTGPALITDDLLSGLRDSQSRFPDHIPLELELIEAVKHRHPRLRQFACFDTSFHSAMPRVAVQLPIPRRYEAQGVRRYGFHGLSYAYLLEELARLGEPAAAKDRVILAHLGNGASLAAVLDGRCVDTSMGFTPASGLMMSTRAGDLDPGLAGYLARREGTTPDQFQRMVNHESGLLGVSETSSDMRDLLAKEAGDGRAAEAVELFCYQAAKWIGSLAAVLGGLDALVFAGGIGENAPPVRARICKNLGFLGISLNEARNAQNEPLISDEDAPVAVRVIRTDEELMIARSTARVLGLGAGIEAGA